MIEKIFKYFKLELNGISLQYGIGGISFGVLLVRKAQHVSSGWLQGLSTFQSMIIAVLVSSIGILFLCHFIFCYIKFRLKYKIYIQLRKVLIILSSWFLVIIYSIFYFKFSWMKALIFPSVIFVVLVFVFALYLDSAIEKFNDFVSNYIENLSLNEAEKKDA